MFRRLGRRLLRLYCVVSFPQIGHSFELHLQRRAEDKRPKACMKVGMVRGSERERERENNQVGRTVDT